MKVDFVGPAVPADDGGVSFRAVVDGNVVACRFSMEALQDVNPDLTMSSPLAQFDSSKRRLLEVAAKRIQRGHMRDGVVWITTRDL